MRIAAIETIDIFIGGCYPDSLKKDISFWLGLNVVMSSPALQAYQTTSV